MRGVRASRRYGAASALFVLMLAPPASAEPQLSIVAEAGAALNRPTPDGARPLFGARGNLFFGRERDADWAVGPSVSALSFDGTSGFSAAAGGAALVPVFPAFPLALDVNAGLRRDGDGARAVIGGSLGWGVRSYNFHSSYAPAAGLIIEARRDLGSTPVTSVGLAVQVDVAYLALPFVFAWGAVHR